MIFVTGVTLIAAWLNWQPAPLQACRALDGDTIRCGETRVRLAGLDAPELRARCEAERRLALAATERLSALLEGGVRLTETGEDRFGRTLVTAASMGLSGACAVSIGFAVDAGPAWLIAVALLWGVTVIADSAQFSAAIAELSDPRCVGTLLTLQTCLGFLLTIATIRLVPAMAEAIGWQHAFAVLAIGPALGAASMWALRGHPDAVRMAGGRR